MENKTGNSAFGAGEKIVFACSGAGDVGRVTDLVARKLHSTEKIQMKCLAVVAAGIEKSIEEYKNKEILMLDGCSVECGKKVLDAAGFTNYTYLRVTDLGYKKGQTTLNEHILMDVYKKAQESEK